MKKILLFLMLGMFMISFSSAALTDDIVSYYKFDETSGSTTIDSLDLFNGSIVGATINQPGIIRRAYDYDGVDDVVTMSSPVTPVGEKSISFWFKTAVSVDGYFL